VRAAIDDDPRLTLEAKREVRFYAEQSEALATFISILGTALAVIFSIGATVARPSPCSARWPRASARSARCARWASAAARCWAPSWARRCCCRWWAARSAWLAASGMQAVDVSTTNFSTFAELAFQFTLTPRIALQSLLFALLMGVVGGFVPAWRAARLKIVDCLRAA
jgi:putative ABC transport system permease protein